MPLMNIEEECKTQFGCENGPCPSCGLEGGCCKKGIKGCGCNGKSGGENRYECTDIRGMELLTVPQNRHNKFISNFEPNQYKSMHVSIQSSQTKVKIAGGDARKRKVNVNGVGQKDGVAD